METATNTLPSRVKRYNIAGETNATIQKSKGDKLRENADPARNPRKIFLLMQKKVFLI
tara:strand:- start:1083 stop:1256 length:174 start_codon:yes stop_codon:yes gene_type:complete